MGHRIKLSYKKVEILSLGLLVLLLAFVVNFNGSKSSVSINNPFVSENIKVSFYKAHLLFKGKSKVSNTVSSVTGKTKAYRKKFKHLSEGDDDHSPYVREVQYTKYLDAFLKLRYEPRFFITQQHAFLFRLSLF